MKRRKTVGRAGRVVSLAGLSGCEDDSAPRRARTRHCRDQETGADHRGFTAALAFDACHPGGLLGLAFKPQAGSVMTR